MPSSIEEIRSNRLKKLDILKSKGINPYPSKISFKIISIEKVRKDFKKLEKSSKSLGIVGRVMAKREHGGSLFFDLFSEETFQVFMSKEKIGEESFSIFLETIDVGDFVAVWGKPFITKKKEPTIETQKWEIVSKSLLPLPEKWHGIQDIEERFRRRYLDLLMNQEVRERMEKRSMIVHELRNFLDNEGFMEVETPTLQSVAGGASALPFKTHHNILDLDLYLRIATEIHLKKLLIAGFNKIYEIGRIFRNEGIDMTHNPEFTSVEIYSAFWDLEKMETFTEKIFLNFVKKLSIKSISFKTPFKRITFAQALERHASIMDYYKKTKEDIITFALRFGINVENHDSKDKIAEKIFSKVCKPKLIEPTFITNHPIGLLPLAKKSSENSEEVLSFQFFINGIELAKAFNELNNPIDQRDRFKKEEIVGKKGDTEAQMPDEEFVEAMEYGMPLASGIGIGIDRLVMLLTETENIKEVILFPTMKPK